MKLPILSFVFIVLCHVCVAQVSFTNNNTQSSQNCPLMEVSISSNNNGIIELSYCNHGNASAVGAYVEIEIANDLLITQSTIPASSVLNKKYTFSIGDVNSLDCGAFYIEIPNIDKSIHCTNVQIFPNNPCQAMIDRYIVNNTNNDDDDDDDNDDDNWTNSTAVTFSAEMYHSVPGPPLLGQGGVNSVFEDHVFLDNIPTWDSLLFVLTNSGVLPNTGNGTGQNTNTANAVDDITTLTSAELCFTSNGSSVVFTDILSQTTSIATGDRTVLGGSVNDNQTFSNGGAVRSEGKKLGVNSNKNQATSDEIRAVEQKYENKEVVVHLYPNPFSTTATITIDGANYQETRLEILDLAGRTVQSLQFNKQESITLHRENLVQGVYIYRLVGDNVAVHTGKFVIR